MGEEGVVSYGPNSPREIEGTQPETIRDQDQDLRNMIHDGMEVYDGEQKKIGKIKAVSGPFDDEGHFYVTVERGFLGLGHDIYIPSQYLSVWDDQVGVQVSKDHIDTMGWDEPPGREENPPSAPPTYASEANMDTEPGTYASESSMEAEPRTAPSNPQSREPREMVQQREGSDEQIQQYVQGHPVERGGGEEQQMADVSYTEAQEPLAMNAAGETEAREEINAGRTPEQQQAYATETEAERTEGTGPGSREQWRKASKEEKEPEKGSPEWEAEERARGAAADYTKYE